MNSKIKILSDANIPKLKLCFDERYEFIEFSPSDNIRELLILSKSEFLFCRSTIKINKELLEDTNVKFVATATSGTDHFDKEYLNHNNIKYFDALGSNSNSVAEYIIFAILEHYKERLEDLKGKKIGIIGFGNVGSKLALYAYKIGLEVIINDPPLYDDKFVFPNYVKYADIDSICRSCDIISNHIPLEYNGKYPTFNLFSSKRLDLLKQNVLFLHASRGKTLDEKAILEIKNEKALTLIFDVWADEPLANINLAKASIIATPHIAGHSIEGKLRGALMVAEAFESFTKIELNKNAVLNELNEYFPAEPSLYNDLSGLHNILNTKRLILQDSELFKNSLISSDSERAIFFKNYRKNYPIRRETL